MGCVRLSPADIPPLGSQYAAQSLYYGGTSIPRLPPMAKALGPIVYLPVLLIHVCIAVLEMVLWEIRGPEVLHITSEKAAGITAMAPNQRLYSGLLVAALVVGLIVSDFAINAALALFSLACVATTDI